MILAIETSTAVCGVALVNDGVVILDRSFEEMHMHAEKLALMIKESLALHHLQPNDLDGIAVSVGPGSFTGLRIGLSTAKGIAFACGVPLLAVPTLKALAFIAVAFLSVPKGVFVLPILDAKRDEVYGAFYKSGENDIAEIVPPCAFPVGDVGKVVSSHAPVYLLGDGVEKFVHYHGIDPASPGDRYRLLPPERRKCSASTVGLLGERMLNDGYVADLGSVEPLYVKEFNTTFKH